MLISNFDENSKIFKGLKAPLIASSYCQPSFIIGAYDGFNIIRTMDVSGQNIDLSLANLLSDNNWINFGITTKMDLSGIIPQELIPMINGPVVRTDDGAQVYFIDVKRELNAKIAKIDVLKSSYIKSYSGLIFNEGEFFEEFNKKKATDGASFLKIDRHVILTLFKGLIPYNKGDIVTYDIYCGERDFLTEFTTVRKKNLPTIKTYIRYLYL